MIDLFGDFLGSIWRITKAPPLCCMSREEFERTINWHAEHWNEFEWVKVSMLGEYRFTGKEDGKAMSRDVTIAPWAQEGYMVEFAEKYLVPKFVRVFRALGKGG